MNERPIVSTLTSCYRGEKYLPLFLERVPEQTAFDRLELVMDLNEPSAEELRLVREFQEKYPGHLRYTVQPKVVTYSASWNNCIRNATGPYLAIWNIDDLRTPDSIERQADVLDRQPDVDLVYGKEKVVPRFGEVEEGYIWDKTREPAGEATRLFVFGSFFMFRKALIERAGYLDEQFRSSADYDFTIRLALHSKFVPLEGNLGYFLVASQGLSTNPNSPNALEDFVIYMRYGIYDLALYHRLAAASAYDFYKIKNGAEWIPVSTYVPNYQEMLDRRYRYWFDRGYFGNLLVKLYKENGKWLQGVLKGWGGRE